jgi:CDP-diglyceride synthetase
MILFVVLGHVPVILLVCLLGLLWLTWVEFRGRDLDPLVELWWGLLVLMTHVAGYLALRVWLAVRDRRGAARRPA